MRDNKRKFVFLPAKAMFFGGSVKLFVALSLLLDDYHNMLLVQSYCLTKHSRRKSSGFTKMTNNATMGIVY